MSAHRWTAATVAALVTIFAVKGNLPGDPIVAAFFVFVILLVDGLSTRGLSGTVVVAKDWLPVIAVLVLYTRTRGIADDLGMPLQIDALINSEKALFFGEIPSVWLQDRFLGPSTAWWEVILAFTYLTHFVASFVLLGVLYARSRLRWLSYLRRFVTLNVAGMLTYILVPAAPPWLASDQGQIGQVERTLSRGWDVFGLKTFGSVIEQGRDGVNHVAALPSLHAGYAFLFVFVLWGTARRSRPLLVLYPALMCLALVIGGEHYVVDLILGAAYAGAIHAGWNRWERRRGVQQPSEEVEPESFAAVGPDVTAGCGR